MHPPLEEWDASYVQSIAGPGESLELEKKASAKFDPVSNKKGTQEELAKQVCAFSNSARGFLVYGITDGGGLDGGVAETAVGTQSAKAWVEQLIPKLIHPAVNGCQAKHIPVPGHHAANYGVLVVEIPLSDHRPHWIVLNNREEPYIRAGEHSARMSLQTFLDISSHGVTSTGEILDLGLVGRAQRIQSGYYRIDLNPHVQLTTGPMCAHWAFELTLLHGDGEFLAPPANGSIYHDKLTISLRATEPLFPGRPTQTAAEVFHLVFRSDINSPAELQATLCAGSSRPIKRRFDVQKAIAGIPE
jgi:hypothetical protein